MSNTVFTMKGYDMYEVTSAFQKSIRRGMEKESMYWGIELAESGFVNHLWKRMLVISTEDVGLANPWAAVTINSLHDMYIKLSAGNDGKSSARLPLTQAILYLVASKKSRHTDWALNYHFDTHLLESIEIPDFALDKHTRRGKAMGRGSRHFFDEGSKLKNAVEMPLENFYKETCDKRWNDPEWKKISNAEKEKRKNKKPNTPNLFSS